MTARTDSPHLAGEVTTFLDDLRRQAAHRPESLALASRGSADGKIKSLTYAELLDLTEQFSAAFSRLGVQPGDVVAAQLPNRWEIAPLLIATSAVGAIFCPIAPVCQGEELLHRLGATQATVCITTAELAPALHDLRAQVPLRHMIVIGNHEGYSESSFDEHFLTSQHMQTHPVLAVGIDQPFLILFTSGTTGFAKGVVHSQNSVRAGLSGYLDALDLDENWIAAVTTPLIHYSGLCQGFLATLMVGGMTVFQDGSDVSVTLDLAERFRATTIYGSPSTLVSAVVEQRRAPRNIDSLELAIVGTSPVTRRLHWDLVSALGVGTSSVWGTSEFGPITTVRADDCDGRSIWSHGYANEGLEIRIDDCADPSRRAEVGRMRVRGASRALGYLNHQAAFDANLTADGWFDTGDVARLDGANGVRVLCRASDTTIRGGEVVPIAELEGTLLLHPSVRQACVISLVQDGRDDDMLVAVIATKAQGGPSLQDLRLFVRASGIDPKFLIDRLVVIDNLPLTVTGKVRKAALRAELIDVGLV